MRSSEESIYDFIGGIQRPRPLPEIPNRKEKETSQPLAPSATKKKTRTKKREPGHIDYTWKGEHRECKNQKATILRLMYKIELEQIRLPHEKCWMSAKQVMEKAVGSDKKQVSARLYNALLTKHVRRKGKSPILHSLTHEGRTVARMAAEAEARAYID